MSVGAPRTAHTRVRAFARSLAGAMAIAALLAVAPAQAAVYDPLNIISYETWRASSSMSVADIQAFLDTQSGPLKSYLNTDTITGPTPVRRSAASIIWRSAQAWNINPKVILATLQKEQSLLTVTSPKDSDNSARLRKAMGCGVYGDANNDGKTDNRFTGFANQVWNGARVYSEYETKYAWYPGKPTYPFIPQVVDGKTVYRDGDIVYVTKEIKPFNACTFGLYKYTPYYPQKLFWNVYTTYFEDPLAPPRLRPVYRFYNSGNGSYLYTASEAKRYTLIRTKSRTWSFQGVCFSTDTSAAANNVPLYQLYNTRTGRFFYTTSASKRDSRLRVSPKQWRSDGVTCYVTREASGTAPVYRLEKKTTHDIFITSSASKMKSLTTGRSARFKSLGVFFYVDSFETTTTPVGPTP